MRGCPATIRAATSSPANHPPHARNPSRTFWTAGRLRRGPVRSPPSQRRSPRFPPACAPCLRCHATGLAPDTVLRRSTPFDEGLRPSAEDRVVLRPALRRIPSPGGQRPSTGELRGAATGLTPDTVARRSTPFDEGLRPSAEDRVVLRPALRRIPSFGGQRPSTGELRGAATGLAPDTVVRRSTPFDEGLRPSAEDRVVLRPALRRIPSPGGQRPSTGELRGAATGLAPDTVLRRSTPFDEGLRPSAEDRVVLRPALRRIPSPGGQRPSMRGCAALRPALFDLPCPYPIAFQTLPKQP